MSAVCLCLDLMTYILKLIYIIDICPSLKGRNKIQLRHNGKFDVNFMIDLNGRITRNKAKLTVIKDWLSYATHHNCLLKKKHGLSVSWAYEICICALVQIKLTIEASFLSED